MEGGSGAEDGTRTRDPHLGKVMLYQLSHFRPISSAATTPYYGAESQIRTGDRTIFSRVLYQLSYLGPPLRSGHYTTSRPMDTNTGGRNLVCRVPLRFLHRGTTRGNDRAR